MEIFKLLMKRGDVQVGCCIWLTVGFVAIGIQCELNKSEWASWVQAIGSIAAILGAIWIASEQARRDSKKSEIAEIQMEIAIARTIYGLSGTLSDIAIDMEHAARKSHWSVLATTVEGLVNMQPAIDSVLARSTSSNAVEYALLMHTTNGASIVATRKALLTKSDADRESCLLDFKSQREALNSAERLFGPIVIELTRRLEELLS